MESKEIDLQAKKTGAEWLATSDRFWLAATPKLFEWLRWAVMIAAISFVARGSASWVLHTLVGVCYGSLLLYYLAYFSQFEVQGFPWLKSRRAHRAASIALTSLLGAGTYAIVRLSVDALVAAQR